MKQSFPLGRIVITSICLQFCEDHKIDVLQLLVRHLRHDWGDLDDEDKASNESALRLGNRVLSAYNIGGQKLYIITEADRSFTTILLAEEY